MFAVHAPMYSDILIEIKKRKQKQIRRTETIAKTVAIRDTVPAVIFRQEWEQEFVKTDHQVRIIVAACCICAVFFPLSFLYGYFKADNSRVAGGDKFWILLTWGPHLICGVLLGAFVVIFTLPSLHKFCVRNYNIVCALFCSIVYINVVWYNFLREIRRSKFQFEGAPQIRWGIEYYTNGSFPIRTCFDTDPVKSWTSWPLLGTALGCNNLILSGNIFCFYAAINFLPAILRMRRNAAVLVTFSNCLVLIFSVLLVGSRTWVLLTATLFQLVSGLSAAYICSTREVLAREQFAVAKCTAVAAERNRTFLHTLIPPNVLTALAAHKGEDMLGTTIGHCTILFCSLEPQDQLRASFSQETLALMNEVFSSFDDAVERYRMFKYQHVADWYIVACPRAAMPFDHDEQSAPYPDKYTMDMVCLAHELRQLARTFRYRDEFQLSLKVGISCGPIAGAVIGTLRAFYCLYGDAVNTAARMCKYADVDSVCASPEFAVAVIHTRAPYLKCRSRGKTEVKGKGMIEIFELLLDTESLGPSRAKDKWRRASIASLQEVEALREREAARKSSLFSELRSAVFAKEDSHIAVEAQLGPDGQQYAQDPRRRIDGRCATFCDPEFERGFAAAQGRMHRRQLVVGLLVHLASVLLQWHVVCFPEYQYDFTALGAAGLDLNRRRVCVILGLHLGLSAAAALALLPKARRENWEVTAGPSRRGLLGLKASFLASSILASRYYTQDGWTVLFATECLCLTGIIGGIGSYISLRTALALGAVAAVADGAYMASLDKPAGQRVEVMAALACEVTAMMAVSAIFNRNDRVRWRLYEAYAAELVRLRQILLDLVPANVADRVLESSPAAATPSRPEQRGEECMVAALQLDICNFTCMSQARSFGFLMLLSLFWGVVAKSHVYDL